MHNPAYPTTFKILISFLLATTLMIRGDNTSSVCPAALQFDPNTLSPSQSSADPLCPGNLVPPHVSPPVQLPSGKDITSSSGGETLNGSESTKNGNCTNNLTTSDSLTAASDTKSDDVVTDVPNTTDTLATSTATGSSEDGKGHPIVTFDEWTKEKLKQEQRKPPTIVGGSGEPVTLDSARAPVAARRNYASRECGAKVLAQNAEAENTKAVLNDKEKDEYMRNPCTKAENKFIVVELCETVQVRTIELGNYELFSSTANDVRVWSSERFPSVDWNLLGDFKLADSRQLQTFAVDRKHYAKFVKLELLSHHGNEHYCTISVLKVLGISMVDEYEAEADAASRLPIVSESTAAPSSEPVTMTTTATTTVASSSDQATSSNIHGVPGTTLPSTNTNAGVYLDVGGTIEIPATTTTPAPLESTIPVPPSPSNNVESENTSSGSSGMVVGVVEKLASVVKDVVAGKLLDIPSNANNVKPQRLSSSAAVSFQCRSCPVNGTEHPVHGRICDALFRKNPHIVVPQKPRPSLGRGREFRSVHRRRLHRTFLQRYVAMFPREQKQQRKVVVESAPVAPAVPVADQDTILNTDVSAGSKTTDPPSSSSPEQPQGYIDPILKHVEESAARQAQPEAPRPMQQSNTPPPVMEAIPAASMSPKESVFMKLNKRIASLELNMSLSSEYLGELSRQFVAQSEEHKKNIDQARKTAVDAAESAASKVTDSITNKLQAMRMELDSLSKWLVTLRANFSDISVSRRTSPIVDEDFDDFEETSSSCDESDIRDLKVFHYTPTLPSWTTLQVVLVVAAAQAMTALFIGIFLFWNAKRSHHSSVHVERVPEAPVIAVDMESLVAAKVQEALQRIPQLQLRTAADAPSCSTSSSLVPSRRQRKRQRKRAAMSTTGSCDSAVAASTTQTETSSEAESARVAREQRGTDAMRETEEFVPHLGNRSLIVK